MQLFITVAVTLPLFAALLSAASALLDLQKRDNSLFLAPAFPPREAGTRASYVPAGLLYVSALATCNGRPSVHHKERPWL